MALSSNAKLLIFNGRSAGGTTQYKPNPAEFESDPNLVTTGYTNATFSSSTGLISIPAEAGTATIGFGSYIPQSYTGAGAIYLYAVTIRDSLGNVLVQEEFDNWSGTLPGGSGERTAQFSGDAGRTWTVYTDATSIYTGYGAAFAAKTTSGDNGIVYPADGGGPFSVLMSTNLTLVAGVTAVTVDLRWGYQINNSGTLPRSFALGYQNQTVDTKDLFAFLSDVTAPTLTSSTPADDATGVALGADIVLSFSENVTAVAGKKIKVYRSSDNSLVADLDATDSQVQVSAQTVTVNPAGDLAQGTSYYVLIDNGAFADSAGNKYAGISSNTALNFTTVADVTPPTLAITSNASQLSAGQTATISFTFSEDVGSSFTASDVTVTGGTLGAVSGTGTIRTATFTPTTGLEGAASISVAAGTYTDLANNAGGAAALAGGIAIDTKIPTLAITSDKAALKMGETATITFTFSEDPGASFGAGDITVVGGTLGALSGTGAVRSATFTPAADSNAGAASITVAAGTYTDAAANPGAAGATPALVFDTKVPGLTISSDKTALKQGETATVTFTFSEDVGNSFTASDVTVVGGTLGAVSGTGTTRTVTFTPTAGLEGTASISVAAATYTDLANNAGGAASLAGGIAVDTKVPTLAITSDKAALKTGETAAITFTFSEDPGASFTAADITVAGGTLGALSGSGTVRSATFTPAANTNTTTASITVAAGSYADAAGNGGGAGATPSLSFDTKAPTLAITSDKAALKVGETAAITFTFSEDPGASFAASDITVSGGTLGALSGSGTVRSATFTPAADTNGGSASITVAAGSYTDAAGNGGGAGGTPSLSFDTKAPTLAITSDKAALKVGETASITFTFSEDPGASFTAADLTVSGGTLGALAGSGTVRSATFTPAADTNGGSASITVAAGSYADAAGNGGGAGGTPSLSFDTRVPTLAITSDKAALKAGETASITFTFSEDPGASFSASDITVSGGTLGALSGTGTVRSASFTPASDTNGGTASVTVAGGAYTDAAGNAGGAGATPSIVFDTKVPSLAISCDKTALKQGETAAITFTFSEDPGASFTASDLAVTGGTLGTLSGSGTVRSATFTPTADTNGGTAGITVASGSYADAAGNGGTAGAMAALPYDTAPPATVFSQFVLSDDTGVSASDYLTRTASQTVTATLSAALQAGDIVYGSTDDGVTWTNITAKVSGTSLVWNNVTLNNTGKLQLKVADAAGNVGPVTTRTYVLDTVAPAVTGGTLALSSDTGVANDFVTSSALQTISLNVAGMAAGDRLLGSVDGGKSWTDVTASVSGGKLAWSNVSLRGTDRILVNALDAAGNSTPVASQSYRVDSDGPTDIALSSNIAVAGAANNVVGTLAGSDLTDGDNLSYSLLAGGDSRAFAVNGNQLVVSDPAQLTAGPKSIVVRATDLAGNMFDKTLSLIGIKGGNASAGDDKDNVPANVEQQVAALPSAGGTVVGDGNGDGKADAEQANVTSVPFLNTRTAQSNPANAAPTFVTLVAESTAGKAQGSAGAALQEVKQLDAPASLPASIQTPLGQISFKAAVAQPGKAEQFSLYVDGSLPVNGYFKQDKAGNWVNLASAEYGGAVVREGGKVRLDFTIVDGGQFDEDGLANGVVVDPGTPGYRALNPGDLDNDQFPDNLEAAHGLKTGAKDNDVFGSSKLFVMQLYRDILFREAEPAGLAFWQGQLDSGKLSRAEVGVHFLDSAEFTAGAGGITRLYLGALGRLPDDAGLAAWMSSQQGGMSLGTIADSFASSNEFKVKFGSMDNAAYVTALYQSILHRAPGQAELGYWSGQLGGGADRGDVLLALTNSAENIALTDHQVTIALSYIGLLDRAPEQAGMEWWKGLLDKGLTEVELVGNFIAQPEYHGRFLP